MDVGATLDYSFIDLLVVYALIIADCLMTVRIIHLGTKTQILLICDEMKINDM